MILKTVPTNWLAIPLYKWVEFERMYGIELDNRLDRVHKYEDPQEAFDLYRLDWMEKVYSFYTDTPLAQVREIPSSLLVPYMAEVSLQWKKEELRIDYTKAFWWNFDKYKCQPIPVKDHNNMTALELDHITDYALCMSDIQDGKPEALYELCAIFIRKIKEPYSTELKDIRKEKFKKLPKLYAKTALKYFTDAVEFTKRHGQL